MPYHIDAEKVSLNELRKRIEETDLVPSRASLIEGIENKFETLEKQGITTFAELRNELKNHGRLEAISNATGINAQYLILLRREIESYFPKPFPLKDFDWLPPKEIEKLKKKGIHNIADLYNATNSSESKNELANSTGVDIAFIETLARLADLTRVQWVSPTTARMIMEAGYESASKLAAADAEVLCEALMQVNEGNKYFKGKIGLRDIKRLVNSAGYVSG